jgi:hypothetical protein
LTDNERLNFYEFTTRTPFRLKIQCSLAET